MVAETLDIQPLLEHLDSRRAEATAPSDEAAATATTLDVQLLRAVDAEINLRAEHIIAPHLPLEHVTLHAELHDGELLVQPLEVELKGGKMVADLEFDASQMPLHGILHTTLQSLDLGKILQPFALTDQQLDVLSGQLTLRVTSADATRMAADVTLPWLGRLAIENSRLSYTDPAHAIDINTTIDTAGLASGAQEVRIKSQGRYHGEAFEVHVRGDPLLDLREPEEPYALQVTVDMAQTRAHLAGQLIHPLKLKGVDLTLKVHIDAGRLTAAPLDFGVANGSVRSRIELDATTHPVQGHIETEVRHVRLNEILRRFEMADDSVGQIGGRAKFWIRPRLGQCRPRVGGAGSRRHLLRPALPCRLPHTQTDGPMA